MADRRRWRALLAPLVLSGGGAGKGLIMAMSMNSKLGAVLLALLALLVALGSWSGLHQNSASGRRSPFAHRRAPRTARRPHRAARGRAGQRRHRGCGRRSGGRPVAGALVALARARQPGEATPPGPGPMATSDGSGRFAFADAWTGSYQMTAAARGFRATRSRAFTLAAGKRHQVELRLGEGGVTVLGQVLDEGGGPIPGAIVTAGTGYPWTGAPGLPRIERRFVAIADEHGRYQLALEPREYELRAHAGGYVPEQTTVAVTRAVTRDIRLTPAARIKRAGDRTGHRAAGGGRRRDITGSSRDFSTHRNTVTDGDGRFVMDDAAAGQFEIYARHRDKNLFGRGKQVVTVATQAVEGMEIALSAGVRLSGRVRDAAGKGVAGVPIDIWPLDWTLMERPRVVSG